MEAACFAQTELFDKWFSLILDQHLNYASLEIVLSFALPLVYELEAFVFEDCANDFPLKL